MCDIVSTKIYPEFLPHSILCAGVIAIAASVAIGKSSWWDSNVGFCDNKWIFPLNALLIIGLILTIVYIWIWYTCLYMCQDNIINILFGTTFILFFSSYLSLFLFKERKAALWLAVIALVVMILQTCYIAVRTTGVLTLISIIIILFMIHYIYQIYHVRI